MKPALIWHHATTGGIPGRSLAIAVIVGTILNLINQGEVLLGSGSVNWLKVALTYVVPYCVSTYGAVLYRMAAEPSTDGQTVIRVPRSHPSGKTD